jgi:uncharacterized membrane protein
MIWFVAQVENLEEPGALDRLLQMDNQALYALVLAVGLPWVMAVVNRAAWPSTVKFALVAVACVLASAGWFVAQDEWDTGDFFRMMLLVLIGATSIFKLWYHPIKEVEERTG